MRKKLIAALSAHAWSGTGTKGALWRRPKKAPLAALSLALFGALALSAADVAPAYADDTNATPKSEVVYAKMDGSGQVTDVFVVNMLKPDAPGQVVDYGNYGAVVNLTDTGALAQGAGSVTANATGEDFTYQGDAASKDLPWLVTITYRLDGQEIDAASLAGASGKLEIVIGTKDNPAVDPVFFENYLLQVTVALAQDKADNVATPDGQIALAGSTTQVTFAGMPDKENSFTLTADVQDFEMDGISFAAIPFSMAIDAPDTTSLTSSFTELNDGIGALSDGAASLAGGAQSLSLGIGELSSGVWGISSGASDLASAAMAIADSSALVKDGLDTLSAKGAGLASGSEEINTGLQGLGQAAASGQELFADPRFAAFLGENPDLMLAAGSAQGVVGGVEDLAPRYGDFNAGVQEYAAGVNGLAGQYDAFNSGVAQLSLGASQLASGAGQVAEGTGPLSAGASQLSGGLDGLSSGTSTLFSETQGMPGKVQDEIDKMVAEYSKKDFKPVSFTSPKNTNVGLVQFVISSEPIKAPAAAEKPEPETNSTFWDRLVALFS